MQNLPEQSRLVTLVLGAGASVEFGYPTGAQLLSSLESYCNGYIHGYLEEAETLSARITQYGHTSIDSILAMEPDLSIKQFGKAMVAASILMAENPEHLHGDCWYRSLFAKLLPGDFTQLNELDKLRTIVTRFKDICIITFNYDLSLEYFIDTFVSSSLDDVSLRMAVLTFISTRIVHVYGSIGKLIWQGGTRTQNDYGRVSQKMRKAKMQNFLSGFGWGEKHPVSDIGIMLDRCLPRRSGIFGAAGEEREFDDMRTLHFNIRVIGEDRIGRVTEYDRIVTALNRIIPCLLPRLRF